MLTCEGCGTAFPPRPGRGVQSRWCDDCRSRRKRAAAAVRNIRHSMATVNEWVEALGPRIVAEKEALTLKQAGRCAVCGRARKLYFAIHEDDSLYGLCLEHHHEWVDTRRNGQR